MTIKEIDDLIIEILVNDGPDGHIDGHEIITAFVVELLKGNGKDWSNKYRKNKKQPWQQIGEKC